MPIQALPSFSANAPPAGPPASASAQTGQEGPFASSLQAASEQRAATARSTGSTTKQPDGRNGDKQSSGSGDDGGTKDQRDTAALETGLNGSAGAALQQPASEAKAVIAAVEAKVNGHESAMVRMLNALTATEATAVPNTTPEATAIPGNGSASLPVQQEKTGPQIGFASALSAAGPHLPSPESVVPEQDTGITNQAANSGKASALALDKNAPQPQLTVSFATESHQAAEQNQAAAILTSSSAEEGVQAQEASARSNDPLVVQNKYGQIITIHQGTAVEKEAATSGKAAASPSESQRLDVNDNYIKAHLPNETSQNKTEENGDRHQNSSPKSQQQEMAASVETAKEAQVMGEQPVIQKGQQNTVMESQPLMFAHTRSGLQTTSSGAPVDSSMFRLSSGSTVPEGTVVDQMIAHFSVNKRLETGTVNLRLYPQELGELRMEIKVEQDNIKAHIIAQNPQAQEMIDRHLPRLREALEQQGLNLQHVEVTIAAHDNSGNERFQESSAWRQPNNSPHRTSPDQPVFTLETDEIAGDGHSAANTLSVLA